MANWNDSYQIGRRDMAEEEACKNIIWDIKKLLYNISREQLKELVTTMKTQWKEGLPEETGQRKQGRRNLNPDTVFV